LKTPFLALSLVLSFTLPVSSPAQDVPQAFLGAEILTIAGDPIGIGALVVHRGKIVAVGPEASTSIPSGAEIHRVDGKVIMPGLVDTHSHIGGPFAADGSHPIQPDARVLDALNVRDAGIQKAQAGGITCANVMSGSGHLMSGQTIYLKLRDGNTIDDLVLRRPDGRAMGGMKMANGTNPQDKPPFPGTRGKSAALIRQEFVKAREYQAKIDRAKGDPTKMPERDLGLEAVLEVLSGERVVHHHTHRHDDIITVLRLREEFGFRVVLHHVSEAWKVADEIAAAGVPCSIILIDSPGGKQEAIDLDWKSARVLEEKGVKVGFHTDDPINDSRLFLRSAGFAVRAGMSRAGALRAVTLANAEMMDLGDRLGSLEVGKDADFIVLSGDPLSVYTDVQETWVDGTKVFDITQPEDRLSSYGGYGASTPQAAVMCCFGREEDR
jgi:imidazolonepropionase-like amidohydrolase